MCLFQHGRFRHYIVVIAIAMVGQLDARKIAAERTRIQRFSRLHFVPTAPRLFAEKLRSKSLTDAAVLMLNLFNREPTAAVDYTTQ